MIGPPRIGIPRHTAANPGFGLEKKFPIRNSRGQVF
jgi:hypothetical protein